MLIYYAAYGSNLDEERFRCYLAGGRPDGATRTYEACPQGTDHRGTRPVMIDRPLVFARRSITWGGGGVAFVGLDATPDRRTFGRAYLLSSTQLLHVARQENRWPEPLPPVGTDALDGSEPIELPVPTSSFYRLLVPLGRVDGHPMVTLTGPPTEDRARAPSPAYRAWVVRGLRSTWPDLSDDDIDRYLTAAGARPDHSAK